MHGGAEEKSQRIEPGCIMKNYREHIDEYLLDQLDTNDKQAFVRQLERDKNLQKAVAFHRTILDGIEHYGRDAFADLAQSVEDELDREGFFSNQEEKDIIQGLEVIGKTEFESIIQGVDKELASERFFEKQAEQPSQQGKIIRMGSRRMLLAIAASLLIMVVAAVFFWPRSTNLDKIYATNFILPDDPISTELNIEKEEIGFAGDNQLLIDLEAAIQLYNRGDCSSFIQSSEAFLVDPALQHYTDRVRLLRGVCFMQLDNFTLAENALLQSGEINAAKYLMLLYIKTGDIDMAKQVFGSTEFPTDELKRLYDQIQ